jgi:hypothetical protein
MSNPNLEQVIPDANKRSLLYRIFAALGIIIGGTQVGFAAASAGQPVWLTVSLAVYAFLGTAGFALADRNTPSGGNS